MADCTKCGGWTRALSKRSAPGDDLCRTCHAGTSRDQPRAHRERCADCRDAVTRAAASIIDRPPLHRARLWPAALFALLLAGPAWGQEEFEEQVRPPVAAAPLPRAVDVDLPPTPPAPSPRPAPSTIDVDLPPEPKPTPPPLRAPNEPPVVFHSWMGRQHAFSGEAVENLWVGGVGVRGPVAGLGRLDLLVDLSVGALPGKRLDLAEPETWGKAAELVVGLAFPVARVVQGGQDVRFEAQAFYGFWTALSGAIPERYARTWGAGLSFAESKSGAFLGVSVGKWEPCGDPEGWQAIFRGRFPLVAIKGRTTVALVGDAGLNTRRPRGASRDVFRLSVAVMR